MTRAAGQGMVGSPFSLFPSALHSVSKEEGRLDQDTSVMTHTVGRGLDNLHS